MAASNCLLILDEPATGAWNMSVDEALLELASETGQAALRIYRWSAPTLSLGYFQAIADRDTHDASRTCAVVRRRSGGGAILHDNELTYSLALPIPQRWGEDGEQLYDRVHRTIAEWLGEFGCRAELYEGEKTDDAFLCFQRRSPGDLIAVEHSHKLLGSAQRRSKNALLQHGSLLLSRSKFAPELPGIWDVADCDPPVTELQSELAQQIASALELFTQRIPRLPDELSRRARQISSEKFDNSDFISRR